MLLLLLLMLCSNYDVAIVVANFVVPQTPIVFIAHDLLKVIAIVTFDSGAVIIKKSDF
jgi:hypothetical protein